MKTGFAAAGCGFAVGAGTLVLVQHNPAGSLAGSSATGSAALLGAGWLMIAVGLLVRYRRPASRFGLLLAAAGFAWFVTEWNNPGAGSSFVFTLGLLFFAVCPALVAYAALSYPTGRLGSRVECWSLGGAFAGSFAVLGLGPALVFDPAAQGCGQCASNGVAIASNAGLVASLGRAGARLGVIWAIALALLAAWRLARSTPAGRRIRAPVVVPAIAYLVAVAASYVHLVYGRVLFNDVLARQLWIAQASALMLVAVGAAWEWPRARRARTAVAGMVVDLAQSPLPGGLREALSVTLGDSDLQIAYPIGDGRCVDASGAVAEMGAMPGKATTALVRDGETIALLTHRSDLLGDPGFVEESASAASLAFENERLQAAGRAQLLELHTSRVRLVAASDTERRRLERDLHDGAQQRLVGLALATRLARSQLGSSADSRVAASVEVAEAEVRRAVDELRELASGIHPAVLTDLGLAAAIEALAEGAKAPLQLVEAPDERLSFAVETAAYLIVAEAAKVGAVRVRAVHRHNRLVIEVDTARKPSALIELDDRVGALDGTLEITQAPGGGVRIRADIPCG